MPAFAFVAGESGVGKSRLVAEFEARAEGRRARASWSATAWSSAARSSPTRRWSRRCGRSASRCPRRRARRRCSRRCSPCSNRLGPVALVIEDLHWADPSTRDFLVFLVRNARTEPLFLLATYRSDELHRRHPLRPVLAELERAPRVERIALERFSRHEVVEQLAGILDDAARSRPGRPPVRARRRATPLYTEELLAASADTGELPATLRDALLGRFERLPAAAQEVVRVAAVAERPMGHELLGDRARRRRQRRRARGRRAPAARHPPRRDVRVPPRARRRGDLRGPAARRADRAARGAGTGDGGRPAPAPQAELACHWHGAHDLPRALARLGGGGHARTARPRARRGAAAARGRARRCGTACRTRTSAPG